MMGERYEKRGYLESGRFDMQMGEPRPAHTSDSHMNIPVRYSFPIPGSEHMTREEAEAWAADFMKPDKPFPFAMERDEVAGITRITFTGDDGEMSTITIPTEMEDTLVFCLEGGC